MLCQRPCRGPGFIADRAGRRQHRQSAKHDDDGGGCRDRTPTRNAPQSGLHGNAGLFVQPGTAGCGNPEVACPGEEDRRGLRQRRSAHAEFRLANTLRASRIIHSERHSAFRAPRAPAGTRPRIGTVWTFLGYVLTLTLWVASCSAEHDPFSSSIWKPEEACDPTAI